MAAAPLVKDLLGGSMKSLFTISATQAMLAYSLALALNRHLAG
jgi:hypothetical protein